MASRNGLDDEVKKNDATEAARHIPRAEDAEEEQGRNEYRQHAQPKHLPRDQRSSQERSEEPSTCKCTTWRTRNKPEIRSIEKGGYIKIAQDPLCLQSPLDL